MTNSEMKKVIAAFIFKKQEAVSARDCALYLGLDPTKTRHYDVLKYMVQANDIEKIEGNKYMITDYGITSYGLKSEAVAPIVKESPLEQITDPIVEVVTVDKDDIKGVVDLLVATDKFKLIEDDIAPKTLTEKAQVWQILEDAGDKIIALQQPKYEIENLAAKLNLLRNALPTVLNEVYSVVLIQIADDLERLK
jgi:hypothetical protein